MAEWHERTYADQLTPYYALLALHWCKADEPGKAIDYLEKAGEQARRNGDFESSLRYFNEALEIEANASVLSEEYQGVKRDA